MRTLLLTIIVFHLPLRVLIMLTVLWHLLPSGCRVIFIINFQHWCLSTEKDCVLFTSIWLISLSSKQMTVGIGKTMKQLDYIIIIAPEAGCGC